MERDIIKEGQEELRRSLLMMNYDMKKTLSENTKVISEQSNEEYFKIRIKFKLILRIHLSIFHHKYTLVLISKITS